MGLQSRREFLWTTSAGLLAGLLGGCRFGASSRRPNVLFIAVDDLRPELGCYGNREIKTPRFDRLAREGMNFTRAHCQAAGSGDFGAMKRTEFEILNAPNYHEDTSGISPLG
jgi:hypothetical protein